MDARELASYFGLAGVPRRSFYTRGGWHTWVVARRNDDYVQIVQEDRHGNTRSDWLSAKAARQMRDALNHVLSAEAATPEGGDEAFDPVAQARWDEQENLRK